MRRVVSILAVLVVALASCGGDDPVDPTASDEPTAVSTPEPEEGAELEDVDMSGCRKAPKAKTTVILTQVDVMFRPQKLEVPAGQKVTLIVSNKGAMEHTFTAEDLRCDSGFVAPGSKKMVTFKMPNKPVSFLCIPHASHMTGKLIPV